MKLPGGGCAFQDGFHVYFYFKSLLKNKSFLNLLVENELDLGKGCSSGKACIRAATLFNFFCSASTLKISTTSLKWGLCCGDQSTARSGSSTTYSAGRLCLLFQLYMPTFFFLERKML